MGVCVVLILIFLIIIIYMYTNKTKTYEKDKINIKTGHLFGAGRDDCEKTDIYCFDDSDCNKKCYISGLSCLHGVCKNKIDTTEAKNECNPSKGVIGYFIGNTAIGLYEYICKSIDPGIAISVNENRMCYNSEGYTIDYLKVFPSVYSCDCGGDGVIVPATSEKREHIECNSKYKDLVPK